MVGVPGEEGALGGGRGGGANCSYSIDRWLERQCVYIICVVVVFYLAVFVVWWGV